MKKALQQGRGKASPSLACAILIEAAATIDERANERDQIQERSMARTIAAFNGLTGHDLSEEDGWMFMAVLKMARSRNTRHFLKDDYLDGAAYIALAGECAGGSNDQGETRPQRLDEPQDSEPV